VPGGTVTFSSESAAISVGAAHSLCRPAAEAARRQQTGQQGRQHTGSGTLSAPAPAPAVSSVSSCHQ